MALGKVSIKRKGCKTYENTIKTALLHIFQSHPVSNSLMFETAALRPSVLTGGGLVFTAGCCITGAKESSHLHDLHGLE